MKWVVVFLVFVVSSTFPREPTHAGEVQSGWTTSDRDSEAARRQSQRGRVLEKQDELFLAVAANLNLTSLAMGRLAVRRAADEQVRQLGDVMYQVHESAMNRLRALSKRFDVVIPTKLGPVAEERYKELATDDAVAFDEAFLAAAVEAQQEALGMFTAQVTGGTSRPIVDYAAELLSPIARNLGKARQLERELRMPEG